MQFRERLRPIPISEGGQAILITGVYSGTLKQLNLIPHNAQAMAVFDEKTAVAGFTFDAETLNGAAKPAGAVFLVQPNNGVNINWIFGREQMKAFRIFNTSVVIQFFQYDGTV